MKEVIQKICNNLVRKYEQDENVLGILLFGSAARGKFDSYSDVDIYMLLSNKVKLSRSNFMAEGLRVDVFFDTLDEAQTYLKEDKNNLRRVTSHMIANGKILMQRRKVIEKIQTIAKRNFTGKTKYTRSESLMHKYSIDDFWGEVQRDIRNGDFYALGLDSHSLITNIVEFFLKLHGEYLRQPNEMGSLLKRLDPNFSNRVDSYYRSTSVSEKKRILSGLVKYIYNKSNGGLPAKWAINHDK